MPLINHENIGAVQRIAYLTATVASVDSDLDTMGITGIGGCPSASGVPIFYHCSHDAVERSNGALEGASGAFADGDEVIVQCAIAGGSYTALRVMGFVDKPKSCEYEFYIRPTFNGFVPTLGGERIKIEHPNYDSDDPEDLRSETASTVVEGDFEGLCGPFTQEVDTGEEYIFLGRNTDSGDIFAHFVEVPEDDAVYHYGYNFKALTGVRKEFEIYSPHPLPILHVNRIDWLRYGSILSGCSKTIETIDEKKYKIYQVDFAGLYFPAMTRTEKLGGIDRTCLSDCSYPVISEEAPVIYPIAVSSISFHTFSDSGCCIPFYGGGCEPSPSDPDQTNYGHCYSREGSFGYVYEFAFSKEQICVLSNELGQSPSYTPITIEPNFWNLYSEFGCCDGGGGDLECFEDNVEYPNYQEYKYEMTLTPEDKF